MNKKNLGYLLMVLGVVGLAVSLGADAIGVGSYPGLHWAQITGAAVGLVVTVVGVWMAMRKG